MQRGIALVRRPGPRLSEGLVTHIARGPVDAERALLQHAAYRTALRKAGWDVREVEPADDLPDAAFVEDTTVFLRDAALLTHPGDPRRRPEVASVAVALHRVGVPTVALPSGTLDGGDVLRVGDRLFVGRSSRTDDAGIAGLAAIAARKGVDTTAVPVTACLHLKTGASALPDGSILADTGCLDPAAFAPLEVVAAREPSGANVLLLGDELVAIAASAPQTARLLEDRGLEVVVLDISEFEAVEAGLTCLSVLLSRPEPAEI